MQQLPTALLAAVLTMKSHLYGSLVDDYDGAMDRARRFYQMDPWKVKDVHRVWVTEKYGGYGFTREHYSHRVIDHRNVYMPFEEQVYLNSRNFTDLQKGE